MSDQPHGIGNPPVAAIGDDVNTARAKSIWTWPRRPLYYEAQLIWSLVRDCRDGSITPKEYWEQAMKIIRSI